ncbi:protein FAR1-RELATED SEQUENCE 5-like [Amaranthus tricolor]|uniref:protein FAR1-RELATED SEQUENCE 5-like n=1 Tax=Amaranthus tricolor TaxID=29722 RepID=UPI002586B65E|nr:protein FAR1-RELATED SEQUENCE 5-like [Amaranthus tricolor]
MAFENLKKSLYFYGKYAEICGFDIRSSTSYKKKGIVFLKYFVCSREGIIKPKPKKSADVVARYKRSTKRIGCKARLILKYCIAKRTYHVLKFEEAHNHCLVSPTLRQYLLGNRKMTLLHKNFISKNAGVNIGPVNSFRLFKENVGGYENVGVRMQDFKNFHRDLKKYIKGDDGKMLIENFIRKRDIYTGFYFDYALDEEDHISRLFWADAISRKNYCLFGEMVTFDCTYNTNKYSMVLAPFTGVDHHKSCITFGIGLLAKEDSESFEWLFRTFLHCMGECMPTYLITNQDPAMKIAIKNRYKQDKLNAESLHTNAQYKTPLPIEKHAGLAQRSESDLQSLLENLKDISRKLEENDDVRVDITKEQQIELLVGTSSSSTMEIQNPIQSKNKGKRLRIIGEKEQTIEQSKKPKRKCKTFGKFDYHDSRNCPSTKDTPLKKN